MNRLIALKDKQIIKVVTGVRRCGKSKLLELYQQWLDSEEEDIRCVKSTYEIEREKLRVEDTETGD